MKKAKVEVERKPPKWKCPTCREWRTEPISRQCAACRAKESP